MADTLYLSLWYPNLRLEALPDKVAAVLGAFAAHGGEPAVYSATVWPINWTETPIFQHVWGRGATTQGKGQEPRLAVEEAMDLLHDDYAYIFEAYWDLWTPPAGPGKWVLEPSLIRLTAHGLEFEEHAANEIGHIQIDFGVDTSFLHEEVELTSEAEQHVRSNVHKLVEFTAKVEKNAGVTGRLLWSES